MPITIEISPQEFDGRVFRRHLLQSMTGLDEFGLCEDPDYLRASVYSFDNAHPESGVAVYDLICPLAFRCSRPCQLAQPVSVAEDDGR